MRSALIASLLLFASYSYAGHPASDAVLNIFDEAARINEMADGSKAQAICRFISDNTEVAMITSQLLGNYNNHADKAGVSLFYSQGRSMLATKIMPEVRKLAGEKGSYTVNPQASPLSGGAFAVSVRVSMKGKNYNATAIVSKDMKLQDAEYLGFSGISYGGRKLRQELDELARKSKTPLSDYVRNIQNHKDYVNCR